MSVHTAKSPEDVEKPSGFIDLSETQLDELIARISEAREHGMALSAADYDLLSSAVLTLASLQERISHNDLTILKLQKLLGMVNSSEKLDKHPGKKDKKDKKGSGDSGSTDNACQNDESDGTGTKPSGSANKQDKRRRKRKRPALKPTVHHHGIAGLNKGDACPGCQAGKVYKYHPAQLLRIVGHSPFSAEQHVSEQLRCSACHEIFTAELPPEVRADGRPDQMYGYSACAMMAIFKYFAASPFYRQETLQGLLGSHVSASTIFDQCQKLADHLTPVFLAMISMAANAQLFYLDDTTHRILIKEAPKQGREHRTGVYSSACLAIVPEAMCGASSDPPALNSSRRLVLYQTSVGHAGEWFDEILGKREPGLPVPTLMSDALSSNHVTNKKFIMALCNSHGRRGFSELAYQCPDETLYALELYAGVWANDTHCKEQGFDRKQRQAYHFQHSLPLMNELKQWCQAQTAEGGPVEPNSNLGRAMAYFVRHYEGLCAFCHVLGAPIDNNICERQIKLMVRGRKNFQFFKTENGAMVSDKITSILATCLESDVNALDYLIAVQRNQLAVRAAPQNWMPWNYPSQK